MSYNARRSNSTLRNKQRAYWKARGLPCGICGQAIDYSLGYIKDPLTGKRRMHPMAFVIDEIIPVSRWREGGYSSPEACAQDISNQRPAHYICNARRGDGTRSSGIVHVVSGAPCSGKTTFVHDNMNDGDIIIDLDAIAQALGYSQTHGARGNYLRVAQAARRGAINEVLRKRCGAWIIHTQPSQEDITHYESCGAVLHVCDPGIDACLERAANDERPDGTVKAIHEWYASKHLMPAVSARTRDTPKMEQPFDSW